MGTREAENDGWRIGSRTEDVARGWGRQYTGRNRLWNLKIRKGHSRDLVLDCPLERVAKDGHWANAGARIGTWCGGGAAGIVPHGATSGGTLLRETSGNLSGENARLPMTRNCGLCGESCQSVRKGLGAAVVAALQSHLAARRLTRRTAGPEAFRLSPVLWPPAAGVATKATTKIPGSGIH